MRPFALQKAAYCSPKGGLLPSERPHIAKQTETMLPATGLRRPGGRHRTTSITIKHQHAMKKIFTSLLLLMAAAVTANAEITTVLSQPVSTQIWQGTNLEASLFSALQYGDKIVFATVQDVEGATAASTGDENHMYYQLQVASWNNGAATYITAGDNGVTSIESDGDVTVELTNVQVDAIKANGLTISGHFVTVNSVSIGTEESGDTPDTPEEGVTTVLWDSAADGNSPVSTGSDWSGYLNMAYDNRGGLTNAKVGDVITVTVTIDGGVTYAQLQIGDPTAADWGAAFDDNAYADLDIALSPQTFSYEIPDAATLEKIQTNGIVVRGSNIVITKVELTTYSDSYDAAIVTITGAGIATYSNSYKALDFANAGIKAYYASAVETGKVTLTPVSVAPAYTGLIVRGDEGSYEIPVAEGEVSAIEGTNYLKAVGDWDGTISASADGIFRYSFTESAAPTFSLVMAETAIPAHKAYLETATDITPDNGIIELEYSDEIGSGIENVAVESNSDDAWYNLQGMRVARPTHGIYIHNGKKVMIK